MAMMKSETVKKAEKLVEEMMGGNDASHDAAHAFRVRDLALSLAREDQLLDDDSLQIVELAALLHDIGDYKYLRKIFGAKEYFVYSISLPFPKLKSAF
ncbi:metal-dependent phosphohydrolase [Tanacetum coccineum]